MAGTSAVEYAKNGDVSIAYTVEGSGSLDLLFVSGFVSHLDIARSSPPAARFFDRLASFARVIRFDKRGQGLSDPGAYTFEDVAADAVAVLDAEGVQSAAVFGVSEGGSASTMLAATYPDRVEAMVQYGTYARMSRAPDFPDGLPEETIERIWTRVINSWGTAEMLELFGPSLADSSEQREWWARLVRSGASPATARTMGDMYQHSDVRPLLASISAPSLILWRRDDGLVPAALSKAVANGIPGARGIELTGRDHLFVAGDQDEMLDPIEEFLTGRLPARTPERILTTVLFVDIVNSTGLAAAAGDQRWRAVLDNFESAWRSSVDCHGGRAVKSTGDGLLATFGGPSQAARCALDIRSAASGLDLQVRAGVHTGECELIGDDIGGIAVHIASRIEGLADPGQVLASGTVRDLSIGSGLTFRDRGVNQLRSVPGEWPLFAVTAE